MRWRYILLPLLAILAFSEIWINSLIAFHNSSIEEIQVTKEVEVSVVEAYHPPKEDIEAIAKTLYGECRGVPSDMEKAAVVWVILNRLDAGYGDTVLEVVSAPYQFLGYHPENPVIDSLSNLSIDVMKRWHRENLGEKNVGRVLPADYLFFTGDGEYNYFRKKFEVHEYWDWSLENPYKN